MIADNDAKNAGSFEKSELLSVLIMTTVSCICAGSLWATN